MESRIHAPSLYRSSAPHRLRGQLDLLAAAEHADAHFFAGGGLKGGLHLFNGIYFGAVDMGDDISRLQPAGGRRSGRAAVRDDLGQADHHDSLGKQLDADRAPQRDHPVLAAGLCGGGHRFPGRGDRPHTVQQNGPRQQQKQRADAEQELRGRRPALRFVFHPITPFQKFLRDQNGAGPSFFAPSLI